MFERRPQRFPAAVVPTDPGGTDRSTGRHDVRTPHRVGPAPIESALDDDVEWVQGQSAVSGTFHGKPELLEHLGRLAEKSPTVKLNRLVAEGDTVVDITEVTAGGETGEDADVFILRDGKTVRVETHGDTAPMERIYGKKQLATG